MNIFHGLFAARLDGQGFPLRSAGIGVWCEQFPHSVCDEGNERAAEIR